MDSKRYVQSHTIAEATSRAKGNSTLFGVGLTPVGRVIMLETCSVLSSLEGSEEGKNDDMPYLTGFVDNGVFPTLPLEQRPIMPVYLAVTLLSALAVGARQLHDACCRVAGGRSPHSHSYSYPAYRLTL